MIEYTQTYSEYTDFWSTVWYCVRRIYLLYQSANCGMGVNRVVERRKKNFLLPPFIQTYKIKWNVNGIHTNLMIAFCLIPNVVYIFQFRKTNLFIPAKVCMKCVCAHAHEGFVFLSLLFIQFLILFCFKPFYFGKINDIDIPTFHTFQKLHELIFLALSPVSFFYYSISTANIIVKCVLKVIE